MLQCRIPTEWVKDLEQQINDARHSMIRHFQCSAEGVACLWAGVARQLTKDKVTHSDDRVDTWLELSPEPVQNPVNGTLKARCESGPNGTSPQLVMWWGGTWYEVMPHPVVKTIAVVLL